MNLVRFVGARVISTYREEEGSTSVLASDCIHAKLSTELEDAGNGIKEERSPARLENHLGWVDEKGAL